MAVDRSTIVEQLSALSNDELVELLAQVFAARQSSKAKAYRLPEEYVRQMAAADHDRFIADIRESDEKGWLTDADIARLEAEEKKPQVPGEGSWV